MRPLFIHVLGAVGLTTVVLACESSRPARTPASPPPAYAPTTPSPAAPQQQEAADGRWRPPAPMLEPPARGYFGPGLGPDDRIAAKTAKPLADGEILAVAIAANDGEVQMAELAKKKASSNDVKQFAAMMVMHHTTGLNKTRALQGRTKLRVDESDLSQQLKNDVDTAITNLRDKEGKAFDRLYVQTQVKAHKDVLDALDKRMLTGAQNTELKNLLTELRSQVADHLSKAEDLEKKLEPAETTGIVPEEAGRAPAKKR